MPTLVPAAQYLRMSTDHQQYSLDNQAATIQQYAERNGFAVVRTYTDAGKSGVLLKYRSGLSRLLQDVVTGKADYQAILVHDISRWGRFQDADEAAHYEFLCKRTGIPVHYCAETFVNDNALPNFIMKALKRTMAAEYSRELGVKSFEGQRRLAQLGFRMGGQAGYGLQRIMVSAEDKRRKKPLKSGEYKNLSTDRVVLAPGSKKELEYVREMYDMSLRKGYAAIAGDLNQRGILRNCKPWNLTSVRTVLTHPKYVGTNVWGRTSRKLGGPTRNVPPEHWVMRREAFTPVVDQQTFDRAQAAIHKRNTKKSDQQLLAALKRLLAKKGRLSEDIIDRSRTVAGQGTYFRRFGPLRRVYDLVGYKPSPEVFRRSDQRKLTQKRRDELLARIEESLPNNVQAYRLSKTTRPLLRVDGEFTVAVAVCRCYRTPAEQQLRWELIPKAEEAGYVTLLCLSNPSNDGFHSSYVMPGIDKLKEYQIKGEGDPWLARGKPLHDLNEFYELARALTTTPEGPGSQKVKGPKRAR